MSPLISEDEQRLLWKSIFSGETGRRAVVGGYRALKYCPVCAQQDRIRGVPPYWRVVENYPATTCCTKHEVLLKISGADYTRNWLPSPEKWIAPNAAIEAASPVEIRIARMLAWINDQKSQTPIPIRGIIRTLQEAALFKRGRKHTNPSDFLKEMRERYGSAVVRVDPALSRIEPDGFWQRIPLGRCLLLAHFLDFEMEELVTEAQFAEKASMREVKERWARRSIQGCLRLRPSSSRLEIRAACSSAYDFLRKGRNDEFRDIVPGRRNVGNRIDWLARDEELHRTITHYAAAGGPSFREALFRIANLRSQTFYRNRHRLPKTAEAIKKLSSAKRRPPREYKRFGSAEEAKAWAENRLHSVQAVYPGITAVQFRSLESSAYNLLRKHSPWLIPRRKAVDWGKRDLELSSRLAKAIAQLHPRQRIISAKLLSEIGEPEQLMRFANGRLPLCEAVLKQGGKAHKISGVEVDKTNRKPSGGLSVDWEARDLDYCMRIRDAVPKMTGKSRASATLILRAAGISHFAFRLAQGRLPKTSELADSLLIPFDFAEDKRMRLRRLIEANPNSGRWALEKIDRHTVGWIRKNDKAYFDRVMPEARRSTLQAE
ncbi:MAG: hypothetical protein JSS11_04900 [Verrucomicrobia bacterium]|nr:hypothetical protein [Verrucomicrobiota bacterium]